MKKIVIASGTGFLGNILVSYFSKQEYEIVILTRGKPKKEKNIQYIHWDGIKMTGWETQLENATALINLAGKSVDCRYTQANKQEILNSRIHSTRILNNAIAQCACPPLHFLNASTATIYRHSIDKQMDEYDGEIGNDFSMNVAKEWENTFYERDTPKTLKTALRTSIVLGKKGGAFLALKNITKLGFGGKQGSGKQWVSWIHEHDFARAVDFIITHSIQGKVNVVSPAPVQNKYFMKELRKAMGILIGTPLNKTMLEIGAKIIGTETELVLKSRNVIPKRLQENGFTFQYANLQNTFNQLLGK